MKRPYLLIAAVLAMAVFICLGDNSWAKNRSGVVTMDFDLTGQEAGKEVRLWIPYPVSDDSQLIGDIRISGDYGNSGVYTDRVYKTPMLYAYWPGNAKSRRLTFSFSISRREVSRRDFPAREGAWNSADFADFLRPTRLGPIDGDVRKLADKITSGKKSVLEKAKAIYDWTCENTYRDPATRGCGEGDVCRLLNKPGGKCTDISSVFVSLCRAAGVPAREVFGLRLGKKAEGEDITSYQHCWAEFYLPGYGWVPADPADVRKAMLVEKLGKDDLKTLEYRRYFWGGIDQYRMVIATGRDLILNPRQAGSPLNTFGYPYAEVGGKAIDWLDAKSFAYQFTFRDK